MEIKADKNKPYIFLDKKECELTIKGKSYPEHPVEFYRPIEEKLIKFMSKDKCKGLTINLSLEILNSVSSKYIYIILQKISDIKNVIVNWYYESDDEDMKDEGYVFKESLPKVSFNIIRVNNF